MALVPAFIQGKAALFDLDGTLFTSMHIWKQVDIDFLTKRGIELPDDYGDKVIHMNFDAIARYTIDRFNLPDSPESLKQEWLDMAEYQYIHKIELKPHAKEYLYDLKASGVKLAVVTSLSQNLYEPALKRLGILSLFDTICSGDALGISKDGPELYKIAANILQTPYSDCVVFEDIPKGIESAKKAGMKAVAVYDDASAHYKDYMSKIATLYISNFWEAPRIR